jgi:8-oxo-dGTP diphosphatase
MMTVDGSIGAGTSPGLGEPADPGRPTYCARCATPMRDVTNGADRPRPQCPACRWTYYAKNSLGAAVVVERGGRILLVRRGQSPFRGDWMLPAGFVEYGENAADTAVREAEEECAIRVRVSGAPGVYFGTDDPRNPGYLLVYRAILEDPNAVPHAGDDAAACDWFAPDALPANIAFMAHRAAIGAWRDHGRPTGLD